MDGYTKAVLTVIAAALVALVVENAVSRASAKGGCGEDGYNPCFVTTSGEGLVRVEVVP